MGVYVDKVLPHITNTVMATGQMHKHRARVCAPLHGVVVEIGFGSGLNITHYPAAVERVLAVEPSDLSWRLSSDRRAASPVTIERAGLDGQVLDLEDGVADTALSTWTLCTIPDAVAAVREIARVLKPGGTFHFVEHGLAPDAKVVKWQRRWEPVQKKIGGGCHVTRDIPAIVDAGGLVIEQVDQLYGKGEPKTVGWLTLGVARKEA